ncbi:stromelysin-3-like [Amphibalanus amphitrite]|uniref:stromelysin-3-like n=1 Tax=Amphibalanus amphitrite TaxID=1232801 RepID=UPI001C929926|nr:stromelysin-3-like [Amphibalanus amphitrite]
MTRPARAVLAVLPAVLAVLPAAGLPSPARLEQLQQQPQERLVQGQAYLAKFGWVSPTESRFGSLQSLSSKLAEFQQFAGLPVTGVMDDATVAKMQQPRCGVPDKAAPLKRQRRRKRYALQGSRWRNKALTYKIVNWPKNRDRELTRKAISDAFQAWADVSALTFTEIAASTDSKANIDVRFEYGDHGDGDAFDGPGGTLAHAFFPIYGGDAHFDKSESFIVTPGGRNGVDLFTVAAHEFGHSLGLAHSEVNDALMAPFYRPPGVNRDIIKQDDIKGIQSMYGPPEEQPDPAPDTGGPPDTDLGGGGDGGGGDETDGEDGDGSEVDARESENAALCEDSSVDAIITVSVKPGRETYVFKGGDYWRLTDIAVAEGYPQRIADRWGGLPDDLDDAMVYTPRRNSKELVFFFKGDKVWRMTNLPTVDEGYPKLISEEFQGIPNDIDAAFTWKRNKKIYFFKGDQYWRFDYEAAKSGGQGVSDKYPQNIRVWRGLPGNLDTVNTWKNGRTYFFKGGSYYKIRDRPLRLTSVHREPGEWWFS